MKFELKKVQYIPEFLQRAREEAEKYQFCKDEDFPGVSMSLQKWPTCLGDTEVAVYRPTENNEGVLPVLLFIHGGAWCTMNIRYLDDIFRLIVQNTGICLVSPDYHLAPENPFPGLLYECYDIANYIRSNAADLRINPERIAVGGDSAGGNIAAAMCIKAAQDRDQWFCAHLLFYPCTDLTRRDIDRRNPDPDPRNIPGLLEYVSEAYAGGHDLKNPLLSPLFISDEIAKKMPSLMLFTSYLDGLCEEGEEYGIKLQKNGVDVTMRRQLEGTHGTLNRKNWGYEDMMNFTYRYIKAMLFD